MLGTYESDFCIGKQTAPLMQGAFGAEWCRQVTDKNQYKTIDYSAEGLDTWNKIVQNCAKECVAHDATTTAKKIDGSACVAFAIEESDTVHECILFPHYKNNPIDGTNHYSYEFYRASSGNKYRSKCYMKHTFVVPDSDDTSDYATYCNTAPATAPAISNSVVSAPATAPAPAPAPAPANCSTYEETNDCQQGLGLIGNAANVDCGGATCSAADNDICCVIPCTTDQKIVSNKCEPCPTAEQSCGGDPSGANTECYGKDDLTAYDVAKLKKLIGDSTIDVATEQTCLKARYNAIDGCSSSTSAYST